MRAEAPQGSPELDERFKPTSAFEEHEASADPGKTAFITEDATGDLSSLAADSTFQDMDLDAGLPDSLPPPEEFEAAAQAPADLEGLLAEDDGDILDGEDDALPGDVQVREDPDFARGLPAEKEGKRGGFLSAVSGAAQAVLLTACLVTPLYLAGGFTPREASAQGRLPEVMKPAQDFIQQVGKIAGQGIKTLLNDELP